MSGSSYTGTEKLFHKIALSGRLTPEMFFDIENAIFGKKCTDALEGKHVFVSGLARAGTTVLMRMLHDTDEFASLTYRDMPMIMAPNLWQKLSGGWKKSGERKERSHGDGLLVGYDSPEALEEVFWRTFCGPEYIGKSSLSPMVADDEAIDAFRRYVGLILLRYNQGRYLSKNNNSILRLPVLVSAFPNSTILVPFRDPAEQAASLLRQHQLFVSNHVEDAFSKNYMTWLGHHEFGGDHRRFMFNGQAQIVGDPFSLSYWLDLWIEAYAYLIEQVKTFKNQALFFSYEQLTAEPEQTRNALFRVLNLKPRPPLEVETRIRPPALGMDRLDEAMSLYDEMTNLIEW